MLGTTLSHSSIFHTPAVLVSPLQMIALSNAVACNFDSEGYAKSTGEKRDRDNFIDLNKVLHSVERKTPSQASAREPI